MQIFLLLVLLNVYGHLFCVFLFLKFLQTFLQHIQPVNNRKTLYLSLHCRQPSLHISQLQVKAKVNVLVKQRLT